MQVNGTTYKVSSPVVDVVDTTGAGDAFNAGFIDALLDEAPPKTVCAAPVFVAAFQLE